MYLLAVWVPTFAKGKELLVGSDWKRALFLLRDSLGGRYGDILVTGPRYGIYDELAGEHVLETIEPDQGIRLEPSFDGRTRARHFWPQIGPFLAQLRDRLKSTLVVHASIDDLWRPVTELSFALALRRHIPTVLVQDTDSVLQMRDLVGCQIKDRAYATVFEQVCRAAFARADLTMLKGKSLMARYAAKARNPYEFQNTSYLQSEVASEDWVEGRLASLRKKRPLRLVYCGRLVARKGVSQAVQLITIARQQGADVTLEVIGSGNEETALRQQIENAGMEAHVHLMGSAPYGPTLLRRLTHFDAMLFMPTAEDTPRMIFDGYAAGLPLLAAAIPYVQERSQEEHATVVLPRNDVARAATHLIALDRNRGNLFPLTRAALRAGHHHAAEAWYSRRADWTHEAVLRHRINPAGP